MINPRVRLIRPLREGAMGTVWVAEHLTLGTEVAVKFISPELMSEEPGIVERFQQEARAAAQIKSPNVVQILDHGVTADAIPYIVMELLDGQSMAEWLELEEQMGLFETTVVIIQVARALARAHTLGIIHRDIKPHNIFLLDEDEETTEMEDQQVKVLDFGIAKRTELPEGLTVPGMVIGTPGYMCPDQVLDGKEADAQTDLWSLSVVAYQALTGELPFYGNTIARLVGALVRCEFVRPTEIRADVTEEIDRFFERAFDRDPERRFATASELAMAFRDATGVMQARPSEVAAPPSPRQKVASDDQAEAEPQPKHEAVPQPKHEDAAQPKHEDDPRETHEQADAPSATPSTELLVAVPTKKKLRRRLPRRLAVAVAVMGVLVGISVVAFLRTMVEPPPPRQPVASAVPAAQVDEHASVPQGAFTMGCAADKNGRCPPDQLVARQIELSAYRIDRREITVAEYRRCADEEACTVDGLTSDALGCNWNGSGRNQHPVNCVSWKQAVAYCTWAGGHLPSEAQWERAARGSDGRSFPWGEQTALCSHAIMTDDRGPGCGRNETWGVGSQPQGVSPVGAADMAGNVREWVDDWFGPVGPADGSLDPTGPSYGTKRVVRGGGWRDEARGQLSYMRFALEPDERSVDVGFRCAHKVE